jgi:hypothetical protein
MAKEVSKSHKKCFCKTVFESPIFGSKIHPQTIAITTDGVINGRKYKVLYISDARILVLRIDAIIRGIITAKTVVERA